VVTTEDHQALFDIAQCERAERLNLESSTMPLVNRDQIQVRISEASGEYIPEGVLLQSWFAANYHHWLVEHLPKIMLIEQAGVPVQIPLLVDEKAYEISQLRDLLTVIDSYHRPVFPLRWAVEYQVGNLIVPSNLFGTAPNLRGNLQVETGDVTVAREAIEFLRSRLAPENKKGSRLIYIDRRAKMAPVRLKNGDAVRGVFERLGFETVSPGTMTFAAQRELFSDAAVIAGESGAAMTNVLLAPKSTVMICLQAQRWPLNIYSDLCAYGGQKSLFIVGEIVFDPAAPIQSYQAPFEMDPDALALILGRIL
jgi:capsular polysaccharide biosynthesis protein